MLIQPRKQLKHPNGHQMVSLTTRLWTPAIGSQSYSQVNYLATGKREHCRKPDEIFDIIEKCSPAPFLELFARFPRLGWTTWGNENVKENESNGVALRKGHVAPNLRLVEAPREYWGEPAPIVDDSFEEIATRRAS